METRIWRHFDPLLLIAMLLLVGFGLAMINSATFERTGAQIDPLVYRQALYGVLGLVIFVILSGLDYHVFASFAWPAYAGSVALLLLVLGAGRVLHGSQRWIQLGPMQFQPSEAAKLALVIVLAKYLASHAEDIRSPRVIVGSLVLPAVLIVLVLLQPDFGTATVYVAIWLGMLFVAGAPLRYFVGFFGLAAAATPAAWLAMQSYQRDRILTFLDPWRDPTDKGYNSIQALISVGAGQLFGRGYLSGSQSQLHFLRVQYADFIFSVLAEELGFVGAVALLLLFVVVIVRGFRAANRSRERFGRLLCCGIVTMLAYQVTVNVGMNVGLLPVTGVPLPMISYGGSSLMTFMGSLGILESVVMRHRKFEF